MALLSAPMHNCGNGISHPGVEPLRTAPGPGQPADRARQEIDYGRRGKGYVFGAFTQPYDGRTTANGVDFLQAVDQWAGPEPEAVFAIVDNLSTHRAADVLLFSLTYPRWHFVFQPTYAAYLNLIEPWWKTLRALALKGRRLEAWPEMARAVEQATAYWNGHRHLFHWGRRPRHRPRHQPGYARVPLPA